MREKRILLQFLESGFGVIVIHRSLGARRWSRKRPREGFIVLVDSSRARGLRNSSLARTSKSRRRRCERQVTKTNSSGGSAGGQKLVTLDLCGNSHGAVHPGFHSHHFAETANIHLACLRDFWGKGQH